jgi:hypothetical protein
MARIMRRQHLSMRGEPVDFSSLASKNLHQPTLGNTRTNVRGDLLGDNGIVLKTQEQVEAEWARKRALQEQIQHTASVKQSLVPDSIEQPTITNLQDQEFPTVTDLVEQGVLVPNKRKIVDRD